MNFLFVSFNVLLALGHLTRVSVYDLLVLFLPMSQTTVADTIAHVISSSGAVKMRPAAMTPKGER